MTINEAGDIERPWSLALESKITGEVKNPPLGQCGGLSNVRFAPESRHVQCTRPCLLWANSRHVQREMERYLVTNAPRVSGWKSSKNS
jgi:hypothetical protein